MKMHPLVSAGLCIVFMPVVVLSETSVAEEQPDVGGALTACLERAVKLGVETAPDCERDFEECREFVERELPEGFCSNLARLCLFAGSQDVSRDVEQCFAELLL